MPDAGRFAARWLVAAVLAALVVRGTLLWLRGSYLDYDEAMYLLLARSILAGEGPVLNGLPHTALGPLVPLVTAGLAKLLGLQLLVGQRVLSALAGALALVPVWALLRSKTSPRVAMIAVILLAAWPALVDVAPKYGPMWSHMYVGSEPAYLCLLFSALAVGEAALRRRGARALALAGLAGGFLALAFLARAEAVVFGGVYALVRGLQFIREQGRVAHGSVVAGFAAIGFLLVASPQLSYLHRVTNKWIISGQTDVMGPTAETLQEMFRDEQYLERYVRTWNRLDGAHTYLLNPYWGTPEGVDRSTQLSWFARIAALETPVTRSWPARLGRRIQSYAHMLWTLCGLPFLLFVVLGLVESRRQHIPAFAVAGLAASLITGFYLAILPRFFLYLVPALAFWAAHGIHGLTRRLPRAQTLAAGAVVLVLVTVSLAIVSSRALGRRASDLTVTADADRAAAEALSDALADAGPVMHWHPRFAYWAGWDWRTMPVTSLDAMAHYASVIGVRYVLLAQVGFSPLSTSVPYLLIGLDSALVDTLQAILPAAVRQHEHPHMSLSEAAPVAGYPMALLTLDEGGSAE